MGDDTLRPVLAGQKALVIGVANDESIAYGCAKAFRATGADLAITWLNEKARRYVEPLARELGASITGAVDVAVPGQLEAMFDQIRTKWGRLDILVHSIAFAPKDDLQGGLLNCSAEGFAKAMDVSCHSFIRMAKLAAPLMTEGGAMFAMSYYGANRVVANYNVMGPVKAALEAACRYLAYELGPKGIRVHAMSPGPLKTRAASGLKDFELLLTEAAAKGASRGAGRHYGRRICLRLSGDAFRQEDYGRDRLRRRRRQPHRLSDDLGRWRRGRRCLRRPTEIERFPIHERWSCLNASR